MITQNQSLPDNPISSTVDFDKDGIQHGHLKLPYSHNTSAWGSIMIPVTVIKNGTGPTALLTGANHGDEYEGPVALYHLSHIIQPKDVTGRIIMIPAMNLPAFEAGTRVSPLDNVNMNRAFPGKPDGTVTQKIADYFQRTLVPMADYVLDIHSGGKSLNFVPFCAVHQLDNKQQQAKCVAAMEAFNAPYSLTLLELDSVGMYDTAVEDMGKIFLSTELGGGGWSTATSNTIAKEGVRNLLIHARILAGKATHKHNSQILDMPTNDCFVSCGESGLLEFCVDLGDAVNKGDCIAQVYNIQHSGLPPQQYFAGVDGILIGRHFSGLIKIGDIIGVVAVDYKGDLQ